jgi:hypothetical protein
MKHRGALKEFTVNQTFITDHASGFFATALRTMIKQLSGTMQNSDSSLLLVVTKSGLGTIATTSLPGLPNAQTYSGK